MKTNVLFLVLLACFAIGTSIRNFQASSAIDFYNYWGVGKAQTWSNYKLTSPYTEKSQYAKVLNARTSQSSDPRLKTARKYMGHLDLTGTPLFYLIFAFLPDNFSDAFALFQTLQIVLFIVSIVFIGSLYHGDRRMLVSLAFLMLLVYDPLLSDLRVGNFNSIQLFSFVFVALFAERLRKGSKLREKPLTGTIFLSLLVFLVLLKPNYVLVAVLIAAHLWTFLGTRLFIRATIMSIGLCAIFIVLPCIFFQSWYIWQDWFLSLYGSNGTKLFFPVSQGNYSTVLLVSGILNTSVFNAVVILSSFLAFSVFIPIIMSLTQDALTMKGILQSLVRLLKDPHLLIAFGITATLALSPLVWLHYYLMSIFPALWLFSPVHRWRYAKFAGGLSIFLTSEVAFRILAPLTGNTGLIPYAVAVGWLPLWVGTLGATADVQSTS